MFLGTFDTQIENKKFSTELEDKTYKLSELMRGPILILAFLLTISMLGFVCEFLSLFLIN